MFQQPPVRVVTSQLQHDNCNNNYSLGSHLGSGQFGTVYKGVWVSPNGEVEVAVKTLKEGSGFLQEGAIMGQFNVVEMYGVGTQGEPVSSIEVHINNRECTLGALNRKLVTMLISCSG